MHDAGTGTQVLLQKEARVIARVIVRAKVKVKAQVLAQFCQPKSEFKQKPKPDTKQEQESQPSDCEGTEPCSGISSPTTLQLKAPIQRAYFKMHKKRLRIQSAVFLCLSILYSLSRVITTLLLIWWSR
jgi:hypothetical protein